MTCHQDDFAIFFWISAVLQLVDGAFICCLVCKARKLVKRPFFNPGTASPTLAPVRPQQAI